MFLSAPRLALYYGKKGILMPDKWCVRTMRASVAFVVFGDIYARWSYGIKNDKDTHAVLWPWWHERMNLQRAGIHPDCILPDRSNNPIKALNSQPITHGPMA
ncbi:unnamed protein product [Vitrella brassicaformis CCMP3155]|uniref:Uncharacterized protein n=1 Tax=Vitrella brassicaformis (strain CCMP3155) TaxID=1169540 RepID=A0A0G4EKK5_VITBC|nr:unnamed protein product [Vitrella brassicaformis CCMP3155]|mmetsp:Transcript_27153/g.67715  ORF Transcript_27153/g.67715 Transcript_27153/m.67715 type:complete len:102 (-) Transcript_27153:559-864(-)|eukprot:CEL97975.1 unnamed protein product [Vitrella brassicaformis CCMP3155]